MKATLVPVHFKSGMDEEFTKHLALVKELLADEAEVLPPVKLGSRLPAADAVVFPQLIGDAFSQLAELKTVTMPVLVLTSDFGTVNMWDWEIVTFMKSIGMNTFTPYDLDQTKKICRSLALKREMQDVKFLVFQDRPGVGGQQAEIFKRFWWWEDSSAEIIREKFGIRIVKKSFKDLGEAAKKIGDAEARVILKERPIPTAGLGERPLSSAVKLYLAVKREVQADPSIQGAVQLPERIRVLRHHPCLAWDLLYQDQRLIWACEADTLSLLTLFLLERSLRAPIMMSNLYPFLMGNAALKHEKIDKFPDVPGREPPAHGPLRVLRRGAPALLRLVEPPAQGTGDRRRERACHGRADAHGAMTLAKLHPELGSMQVIRGELESYVQYPGSDCRNGALLKVRDGRKIMKSFYSHHYCLMTGEAGDGHRERHPCDGRGG